MAKEVVLFEATEEFKPFEILLLVLGNAPANGQGMTFADMKKRLRVIDVVEEAQESGATSFVLEDEDYNQLKDVMNAFQGFTGGSPKILRHLTKLQDAVMAAKRPAKTEKESD